MRLSVSDKWVIGVGRRVAWSIGSARRRREVVVKGRDLCVVSSATVRGYEDVYALFLTFVMSYMDGSWAFLCMGCNPLRGVSNFELWRPLRALVVVLGGLIDAYERKIQMTGMSSSICTTTKRQNHDRCDAYTGNGLQHVKVISYTRLASARISWHCLLHYLLLVVNNDHDVFLLFSCHPVDS